MLYRRTFLVQPNRSFDQERLIALALPKDRSAAFIPDKPSIYWLDYILDDTPRKLTSSIELQRYYRRFLLKTPRIEVLSRPKTTISDGCDSNRPITAYGKKLHSNPIPLIAGVIMINKYHLQAFHYLP
jgi:hypothetical protein